MASSGALKVFVFLKGHAAWTCLLFLHVSAGACGVDVSSTIEEGRAGPRGCLEGDDASCVYHSSVVMWCVRAKHTSAYAAELLAARSESSP